MEKLPVLSIDLIEVAKRSDGTLSTLDHVELEKVLERYQKFLYLAQKYPNEPLSPTFDIDEMWHLHMLHPRQYYDDCMVLFGQIMGHETSGTTKELTNYSNLTENIWKKEFNEEYRTDITAKLQNKGDTCYKKSPETCYKDLSSDKSETCYKDLSPHSETCYKDLSPRTSSTS